MHKSGIIAVCLLPLFVSAKDLGTWGALYPVIEPDMLSTIRDRLQAMEASGEMAREQDAFKQRVITHTLRPAPVAGITIAQKNSTHYVDPSFVLGRDLADQSGRVFAHKGQRVNPLDTVPFNQTLYFIDADNSAQMAWMQAQHPNTVSYKVILVNGDVRVASQRLDTRIYFDQEGVLSQRFGVQAVPARVTLAEDRRRLRVDVFALGGQEGTK